MDSLYTQVPEGVHDPSTRFLNQAYLKVEDYFEFAQLNQDDLCTVSQSLQHRIIHPVFF
jgi:hypothetical protein